MNARAMHRLLEGLPNDPISLTASVTLNATELLTWRLILLNSATGLTLTLPRANGSGTSLLIIVLTAITSGTYVIKRGLSTDVINGVANVAVSGTAGASEHFFTTNSGSQSNTITLNGSTQGGNSIGDQIELYDCAAGQWIVQAVVTSSGSPATPFSHT